MNWNFTGNISSKRLLPAPAGQYQITLNSWYTSEILSRDLRSLLDNASKTAEIMHFDEARDILLNIGKLGEALVAKSPKAKELSFLNYWPHADGDMGNHLSVVIGLTPQDLEQISANLDQALYNQNPVRISCTAGFSAVENNSYSIQPTFERFQFGEVLPLMQPARISVHPTVVNKH